MWDKIAEMLQDGQHPESLDVGEDSLDEDDDDVSDPTEFAEADDEF
jgi:hypothetical protein